jgi:superfamily II DNA or RNA helicase
LQKTAIWSAIDRAQALIRDLHCPDGFNVGFNQGAAAGQTIFHFHLHVIPRYAGDVPDPRGGVRHVIPSRANYLSASGATDRDELSRRLVTGDTDHLLEHLRAHLDRASRCDIAVAFLMDSGARMIVEHLRDFLKRGGAARILVGDYLDVTEPIALRRLSDLHGDLELRVYEARNQAFHLKTYIFLCDKEGIAFVGSSNLSASALTNGIEWNYRVVASDDKRGFHEITSGFEDLFLSYSCVRADEVWIKNYEQRRHRPDWQAAGLAEDPPAPVPEPHALQQEALDALNLTRRAGFTAGLVVLATGLGKTWLAAFDSARSAFRRLLFVAHREEILDQAVETFRRIRPSASIGRLDGVHRDLHVDLLFASVQTLGRVNHLTNFTPDAFDYIIVDEFHHAAAATYRRVIDYFEPKFLLGLTATPERMDGGDLLALCQENLVFEASVTRGIAEELLSPFQYWGVPDEIDYANIPWRNARFDLDELTAAVATEARAQNALDQFRKHGGERCIAFCCSQRHADFMTQFFSARGVRSVAVHSGVGSAPRATSLEELANGRLDVIFSVDMFNEGVDVPAIDTVLMLRPTESTVVWMQQFGRGLRTARGKPHLKVIDYIGNHRAFLTKLRAIAAMAQMQSNSDSALRRVLDAARSGQLGLPDGCSVTYELQAVDILL